MYAKVILIDEACTCPIERIEYDVMMNIKYELEAFDIASSKSALEQCIYLFVEGESEERAFWILLEEGLGINFDKDGVVLANYNGIGNLKHTIRLMQKTLSHTRPMIFTFDDDDKKLISNIGPVPSHSIYSKYLLNLLLLSPTVILVVPSKSLSMLVIL